jgi:hypothetical protein
MIRVIVPILLSCSIALGQFSNRITNYCKNKDFVGLITLIDSLHETGNRGGINYSAYTEVNRQIVGNYYETILNYEETETIVLEHTIKLISDSNKIIYCKFSKIEFKDKPETVYNFLDKERFLDLKLQYNRAYNKKVNIKDFFIDDVVYGKKCGKAPVPPEYREICEKAIANKNTHLLNNWLVSVNTEKQVYAVEAFLRLEKSGMTLNPEQKQRIDLVKNKKGTLRGCAGCFARTWEIDDALKYSLK